MNRNRIRNIITYILLLLAVLYALIFYRQYTFFVALLLFLLLPVISGIWMKRAAEKVEVNVLPMRKEVNKNQDFQIHFSIENKSWYPIANLECKVKIENSYYPSGQVQEFNFYAPGKRKQEFGITVTGISNGCLVVVLQEYCIYDWFQFFKKNKKSSQQKEIMVRPTIAKVEQEEILLAKGDGDLDQVWQQKGSNPEEVLQIREYIPGDRLQNIHWKLSAKQEEWMVKDYSTPYTNRTVFLLELYAEEPEYMDSVLDAYFSYAYYYLKERRKFSLSWYGNDGLKEQEIFTEEDIVAAMREIYYLPLQQLPNVTYDYYKAANQDAVSTTFYFAQKPTAKTDEGEEIAVFEDRAVIRCL